jgi:hypothetical protein
MKVGYAGFALAFLVRVIYYFDTGRGCGQQRRYSGEAGTIDILI